MFFFSQFTNHVYSFIEENKVTILINSFQMKIFDFQNLFKLFDSEIEGSQQTCEPLI